MASSCAETSEFLTQQQHTLSNRKVEELTKILEAVDNSDIFESVIRDVGGEHHLKIFPDRIALWGSCTENQEFKTFVSVVFREYISLVRQ